MKKSYVKPQVYFEDFQLSASIAGDCKDYIQNPTEGTCGYIMVGMTIFLETVSGCLEVNGGTPIADGKNEYNTFCYHTVDGPFFAS